MCELCTSYVARSFLDYKGRRIFMCQPCTNACLRVVALLTPDAFANSFRNLETITYGREESVLDIDKKKEQQDANITKEQPTTAN